MRKVKKWSAAGKNYKLKRMKTTRESIFSATFRSGILMASLMGILVGAGFLIGGPNTALIFLAFGLAFNIGMLFFSDKIALRMSGAVPLEESEAPEIYEETRELALRAKIPIPRLYRIPQQQANAFATGRSPAKGVVALTDGLLRALPKEERKGVIAHEIAHIAHRDTLVQSLAAAIGGAISYLGYMVFWIGRGNDSPISLLGALMLSLLAPLAAGLIQMAISRQREYGADARGASLTGNPEALAQALLRIERIAADTPLKGHVPPSSESLYIIKPFAAKGMSRLFSTHPPTEQRVARLEAMRPTL